MIEKVNTWIIEKYIDGSKVESEFDKERIKYGLSVILNETEKIIGIFLIFAICDLTKEFIISFIVLMSLRIFIGGYHFSKNIYCFCFSFLFFLLSIILGKYIELNKYMGIVVCIISMINIIICAPLQAKHRAILKSKKKRKLKISAVIVLILLTFIYELIGNKMANIIVWTIILQQIEIICCVLLSRREV